MFFLFFQMDSPPTATATTVFECPFTPEHNVQRRRDAETDGVVDRCIEFPSFVV